VCKRNCVAMLSVCVCMSVCAYGVCAACCGMCETRWNASKKKQLTFYVWCLISEQGMPSKGVVGLNAAARRSQSEILVSELYIPQLVSFSGEILVFHRWCRCLAFSRSLSLSASVAGRSVQLNGSIFSLLPSIRYKYSSWFIINSFSSNMSIFLHSFSHPSFPSSFSFSFVSASFPPCFPFMLQSATAWRRAATVHTGLASPWRFRK